MVAVTRTPRRGRFACGERIKIPRLDSPSEEVSAAAAAAAAALFQFPLFHAIITMRMIVARFFSLKKIDSQFSSVRLIQLVSRRTVAAADLDDVDFFHLIFQLSSRLECKELLRLFCFNNFNFKLSLPSFHFFHLKIFFALICVVAAEAHTKNARGLILRCRKIKT